MFSQYASTFSSRSTRVRTDAAALGAAALSLKLVEPASAQPIVTRETVMTAICASGRGAIGWPP